MYLEALQMQTGSQKNVQKQVFKILFKTIEFLIQKNHTPV